MRGTAALLLRVCLAGLLVRLAGCGSGDVTTGGVGSSVNAISVATNRASVDAVGNRSASRSSAPAADRKISPWPAAMARNKACPVAVKSSGVGAVVLTIIARCHASVVDRSKRRVFGPRGGWKIDAVLRCLNHLFSSKGNTVGNQSTRMPFLASLAAARGVFSPSFDKGPPNTSKRAPVAFMGHLF
jgi:hypothetical protein